MSFSAKNAIPAVDNFQSPDFLLQHIAKTMAFYNGRSIDNNGGFFHYYLDNGDIYNADHRHLVSSTRFVFNNAMAYREFKDEKYKLAMQHGLNYLRNVHRNAATGGYNWTLQKGEVEDNMNHCYGVAFVLLAYSTALKAGETQAKEWMEETWQLLEKYFWDADSGLYKDEADAAWNFSTYRGQNANMHMCEAMIAAYEASQDKKFLDRALLLADNMTRRQANLAKGVTANLIWEHYDIHWQVDWNYNLDNPKHLFRPWGFQPGHQTEWAKLLLLLDRYTQVDWLVPTAKHLFDKALEYSWDHQRGGMYYGFAPDGSVCDDDKYFWVQAESLAAAALLAHRTGEAQYWDWYNKLWAYSWEHFVDHEYGAWYRILDANNKKYDNEKSPAGKTDYHTMGACYEVLNVVRNNE